MMQLALATEDILSEAICLRLLAELPVSIAPNLLLRRNGFGYLRSNMDKWVRLAQNQAVFLLTDLDRVNCPAKLISDWVGIRRLPVNFLLRIAVREIESWILADHESLRLILGDKGKLPQKPDELPDAKQYLLQLAKYAQRNIRLDLVQENGAIASQGIGYNARLTALVQSDWSPDRAAERSPSLRRTRQRLLELFERNRT